MQAALEARRADLGADFPIGPVGSLVRVREARWGCAVTDCLSGSLATWLVRGRAQEVPPRVASRPCSVPAAAGTLRCAPAPQVRSSWP